MQFTKLLLAATACAIASAAKIGNTPATFVGVTAGSTFNISWIEGSGAISIILKNGESTALKTVSTIVSGLSGTTGSYAWSIPSTLPTDTYALEIDDSTGVNYSVQFKITGGPAVSSSASSASTSLASSATSSRASSATSASSSVTASTNSNSTTSAVSSHSSSASVTSTGTQTSTSTSSRTSSSSSSTATVAAVNSAAGIASPLALVLLAFAAIGTLN